MYIYSLHIGGGAENIFFKVAVHLKKRGFEPVVCGMLDEYPSFEEQFKKNNIKVINLSCTSHSLWHILKKLLPVLKKEKPAVMFNWLYPCIITGGLAAKLCGVPQVINNLRGPDLKKKKVKVWLERLVAKLYTGHIAVSPSVAAVFCRREKYCKKKITVIENGLDQPLIKKLTPAFSRKLRQSLKISPADLVVGSVGRLYIEKNQQLLISALPQIKEKIPQVKLLLVGDGPYRPALESLVSRLNLTDSVIFAGWQRETYKYLQLMDIYVLPSWYEGHPGSILQAWLMKLPVVATKVSGSKDLVIDGKNGLLVSKTEPSEMANVIINLKNNKKFARTLALDGYATVRKNYTEKKMLNNYEKYFKNLE